MTESGNSLKTDLPHYRWALLTLLLALGVGGGGVLLSRDYVSRAQKSHVAALKQLADARSGLEAAQDDRENMAAYAEGYAELLKRNIIGDEQRLDWIDGLEAIRRQGVVLGIKYTISPQQPYKPAVAIDSGNFNLNQSGMTVNLELLHEGQLVNFYNAVRGIPGWFVLDGCSIERLAEVSGAQARLSSQAPRLRAECKGGWVTLKNRSAP